MNNVGSTYIVDNEKIRLYSVTKKSMDLILSFIGLILLIPVFLILAILVKQDSKGPVFYAHTRKGKNRSDIKIYKFRTMYSNSDEIFESFSDEQKEEYYKNFKLDNDPRVTKVGDFLRRTSLDEIPQLINVLKGDLSLVGPRPIVEKEICKYGQYADIGRHMEEVILLMTKELRWICIILIIDQYYLILKLCLKQLYLLLKKKAQYKLKVKMEDYYVSNSNMSLV